MCQQNNDGLYLFHLNGIQYMYLQVFHCHHFVMPFTLESNIVNVLLADVGIVAYTCTINNNIQQLLTEVEVNIHYFHRH